MKVVHLLLVIIMVLIIGPFAAVVVLAIFGVVIASIWAIALVVAVPIAIVMIIMGWRQWSLRVHRVVENNDERGWTKPRPANLRYNK